MSSSTSPSLAGKVNAPEFPPDAEWLNTDRPLTFRDLRGKVVLLDFWTYCCINCIHVIPDLKKLEAKYPNELVVIGVHAAKFATERETENIRQAVLRYEITHPVVNDSDFRIWQSYAVRAWPTLVLIDPAGKVIGQASGEGIFESFDKYIGMVVGEFDARGLMDRTPLTLRLERAAERKSVLSFPGKVLADEASSTLFIADSNHNRIIVAELADGRVRDVIGTGTIGIMDGTFESATFDHPQGLALDGDRLYIADTENHVIRVADLRTRIVERIAGTGAQAREFNVAGIGRAVALNSPWDLVIHNHTLYIAMAGPHQLWTLDTATGVANPYAGTGAEALQDGPLLQAALAQPSGITTDGQTLYFADSEVSAIRAADLDPNGRVETLAGLDLFKFGDVDGYGDAARLQHPLGVTYHDGLLYVADTYNNKIKQIDPKRRFVSTLLGTGEAGHQDGDAPTFDEPAGVSAAHGKLYIADTNNHAIRVADLRTRETRTFELRGIT